METGYPVIHPVFYSHPMRLLSKSKYREWKSSLNSQYFLGQDLLVGSLSQKMIYLPTLNVWYNWWDGLQVPMGGLIIPNIYKGQFPIYIRGGGIFSLRGRRRRSAVGNSDPFSLLLAPAKDGFAQGVLYIDDYTTTQYILVYYIYIYIYIGLLQIDQISII